MSNELTQVISSAGLRNTRRKVISLSAVKVVTTGYLDQARATPLVISPHVADVNLVSWIESNREYLDEQLLKHGAILFRGFPLDSVEKFSQATKAVAPELLNYSEPSSPRSEIKNRVYTSTEYPSSQWIQLHNEMSYSHQWPKKVFFFCQQPAVTGGETPIASSREVFLHIDVEIRDCFIEKQVMYVRNFGDGLDLPWQHVFGTTDKSAVESYCRAAHIEFEWKTSDRLRTRQIRQSVLRHPMTGELLWFNQVHAFHLASLEPTIRQSLLAEMSEREVPRHAFYGDGSPIEDEVIAHLREAYRQVLVAFPWQQGDMLLLDNMLMAHGRAPFTGARKILVAMSGLFSARAINA